MRREIGFGRKDSGIALIVALIFLVFCGALAAGFLVLVHQENSMTASQGGGLQALWLAEAAGQKAYNYIVANSWSINDTVRFGPQTISYPATNGTIQGTIQYKLYPFVINAATGTKQYTILANGTYGIDSRTLEIKVETESFADYAWITDQEKLPGSGTYTWGAGDSATGRAHSNDRFNFTGSPIFYKPVTSSSNLSYNGGSPVFRQPPYKYAITSVTFPTDNSILQKAAYGGSPPVLPPGVYFPIGPTFRPAGGIYAVGDWQLKFSPGPSVDTLYFINGTPQYQFIINYQTKQTTFDTVGKALHTYSGLPNGAIFVNGDVSLSGTVFGAFTVGTDLTQPQDITIIGDLNYYNTASIIGLVSRNVTVTGTPAVIKAFILAAGKQGTNQGSFTYPLPATFTQLGGVYQRWVGLNVHGPDRPFIYDIRGEGFSPPFYPTTGRLIIDSWREVTNTA